MTDEDHKALADHLFRGTPLPEGFVFHADKATTKADWDALDPAIVARMGLKRAKRLGEVGGRGGGQNSAPRIGTPELFRDLLISIASTAKPQRIAA